MTKTIIETYEIEVDDDRPECCNDSCDSYTDPNFCYRHSEILIVDKDLSIMRCLQCLKSQEVGK